jgi:hypothetical protein
MYMGRNQEAKPTGWQSNANTSCEVQGTGRPPAYSSEEQHSGQPIVSFKKKKSLQQPTRGSIFHERRASTKQTRQEQKEPERSGWIILKMCIS